MTTIAMGEHFVHLSRHESLETGLVILNEINRLENQAAANEQLRRIKHGHVFGPPHGRCECGMWPVDYSISRTLYQPRPCPAAVGRIMNPETRLAEMERLAKL